MTRQQRLKKRTNKSLRKQWLKENGKYLLVMVGILLLLGYVGKQDSVTQLYETTISTCDNQGTDGELQARCAELIAQVQKDKNVEVLSKNGTYWIEVK